MTDRTRIIVTAASLALLVTEIIAVALFLSIFLTLSSGETMLERWGLMPLGWGAAHQLALLTAAAVPTALVSALTARWFYRRVVAIERGFDSLPPR